MAQKNIIAIIGGGCSGTAAAIEIARRNLANEIVFIEKDPTLHRGLAYSTQFASHLLNVPASRMSIRSDDPIHFLKWLKLNGIQAAPSTFIPRMHYGSYLEDSFNEVIKSSQTKVTLFRDCANGVRITKNGFDISFQSKQNIEVNQIIITSGWNIPTQERGSNRSFNHAYKLPDELPSGETALIVGSGLTAVDTLLSLRGLGFKGKVIMVSRRGIMPKPHSLDDLAETSFPPIKKFRALLRYLRLRSNERILEGLSWQGLLDSFKPLIQGYWQNFSIQERSAFLRHIRPYWDAHRHRMPNEIANIIESEIKTGQLAILPAKVIQLEEDGNSVIATIRRRGHKANSAIKSSFVIKATGTEVITGGAVSPLLQTLFFQNLASPDIFSLGIECTTNGELLDSKGQLVHGLFVSGPPSRGSLWESTAVPEIVKLSGKIADVIEKRSQSKTVHTDLYNRIYNFEGVNFN